MQKAMNLTSGWAKVWLVMISRTKTEATCFSLSPKREEFILQISGQEIHQQDTPNVPRRKVRQKTDLVSPHKCHAQQSSQENSPGNKKQQQQNKTKQNKQQQQQQQQQKLAGTNWGANMKIFNKVYTATVLTTWSIPPMPVARTNLDQLTKPETLDWGLTQVVWRPPPA